MEEGLASVSSKEEREEVEEEEGKVREEGRIEGLEGGAGEWEREEVVVVEEEMEVGEEAEATKEREEGKPQGEGEDKEDEEEEEVGEEAVATNKSSSTCILKQIAAIFSSSCETFIFTQSRQPVFLRFPITKYFGDTRYSQLGHFL